MCGFGGPTTIATGWPLRRDVDRTTAVALVPHPVPRVQAQASCFAFKSRASSGVICIGQIVISSLIYLCPCKHGLEPLQSPESSCVFLPGSGTKTGVHLLCCPSTSGPIYTGPGFSCSRLSLNEPYKLTRDTTGLHEGFPHTAWMVKHKHSRTLPLWESCFEKCFCFKDRIKVEGLQSLCLSLDSPNSEATLSVFCFRRMSLWLHELMWRPIEFVE